MPSLTTKEKFLEFFISILGLEAVKSSDFDPILSDEFYFCNTAK